MKTIPKCSNLLLNQRDYHSNRAKLSTSSMRIWSTVTISTGSIIRLKALSNHNIMLLKINLTHKLCLNYKYNHSHNQHLLHCLWMLYKEQLGMLINLQNHRFSSINNLNRSYLQFCNIIRLEWYSRLINNLTNRRIIPQPLCKPLHMFKFLHKCRFKLQLWQINNTTHSFQSNPKLLMMS